MSHLYEKPLQIEPEHWTDSFHGIFLSHDSLLIALHGSWKELSYEEIKSVFERTNSWNYSYGDLDDVYSTVEEALEKFQRSTGEVCYYCNGPAKTGKDLLIGLETTDVDCEPSNRRACVYCSNPFTRALRAFFTSRKNFGICHRCGNYRSGKSVTEMACGFERGAKKDSQESSSTYHLCFSCLKDH